ncbi:SDR family oxidoreductase [Bacillus mojavensis]|uniref:SDR family oxidoreductase n=1 Tax=Bacillus mojavensis TaxID=72360 RepID=UPI002DBD2B1C|nr:SDR family oxidoreductase [Bacillus mojavensis]MEC1733863.1 SDR family oxidoreductase [Bacillus mojavensis]MED1008169.1 SDR family oxidoreductase [Bacillus mojavensis]
MSKLFIIGANGKVGKNLVNILVKTDHEVTVGLRNRERFSQFEEKGVKPVYLNLEDNVEAFIEAMQGSEVIVFTAGSGGHTGFDKTILIDLHGAAKAIQAAENISAKQFIIVSSPNADRPENWTDEKMTPYYIAKHHADRILKESKLNYTILRPGILSDEKGTGKITTDVTNSNLDSIPREDVARVIVEAIGSKKAYKKIIPFVEGDTLIKDLFA